MARDVTRGEDWRVREEWDPVPEETSPAESPFPSDEAPADQPSPGDQSGAPEPGPADESLHTVVVTVGKPSRLSPLLARLLSRRPSRRVVLRAAGLVGVVVVAIAAFLVLRGPGGRHADGAGILASTGSPDSHNSWGREATATGPVTGAIRLCLQRGTDPAVIEAIGPDRVVGAGWRYLGASVRVFTPGADHTPIISMDRYPPPLPDPLEPAIGFDVRTPCGDVGAGPYTELLLGLAPTDPAGGGWDGIDVTYRVGGTEYVLVVRQAFVQCGTSSMPDYCSGS